MAAFSFMNRSRTDHQPLPMPILIFCCVRIFLPVHFALSLSLSPGLPCLSHFLIFQFFFFCLLFVSVRFGSVSFVFSAFLSTAQLIKKRFRLALIARIRIRIHSRPIATHSIPYALLHHLKISTMFGLLPQADLCLSHLPRFVSYRMVSWRFSRVRGLRT